MMLGESQHPKKEHSKNKKRTLKDLFIEYAKANADLDERGVSEVVMIEDLKKAYPDAGFALGNGRSWCRDDGPLGKEYRITPVKVGNSVVGIKLDGHNRNPTHRTINKQITKIIKAKRCAVLAIGKVEVDHKDGRYETRDNDDPATQKIADFQPLSKHANTAKRQHCKDCKEGGGWNRFDATRLGYSHSFISGDRNTKSCQGCYWFDPEFFNQTISKDYRKTK